MKDCTNCGRGGSATCRTCAGKLLCVANDTTWERKRGEQCSATCMWCGRVANAPDKPLPLVARRRITPAPIQGEITRAGGR